MYDTLAVMYVDFSSLHHISSKDISGKGTVHIPPDDALWPQEWKTVFYKQYERLPKISLDRERPQADYFDVLHTRQSRRDFSGAPVSKATLSKLLLYSAGIVNEKEGAVPTRAHPSGGGRFPLEVYPIMFAGDDDVPAGVYHYDIKDHALDVLWQRPFSKKEIADLFVYEWIQSASFALVITAVFWRNQIKYGERGYRYTLLEAGHLGENVYLTAEALGIKCCAMGGSRDERVEKLLDIDGINESLVHTVVLG